MRKIQQSIQVVLAMIIAAIASVGLAQNVYGQNEPKPLAVNVIQRSIPNTQVRPGGVIHYEVVANTTRSGGVGNVTVSMMFNPAEVEILDVKFDKSQAWVNYLQDGKLNFQTGRIDQGGSVSAAVRVRVLDHVPQGTVIGSRLTYMWKNDRGEEVGGAGNYPTVVVSERDEGYSYYPLMVNPTEGPQGTKRIVTSDSLFAPGESISVWFHYPNGTAPALGVVKAGSDGRLNLEIHTWSMGEGTYNIVAHGNLTNFTAVGNFVVAGIAQPIAISQPQQSLPQLQSEQKPSCITCHTKHQVKSPHTSKPTCTTCHGDSKKSKDVGCVECHSLPNHQRVVRMPHPSQPKQSDVPCTRCHAQPSQP